MGEAVAAESSGSAMASSIALKAAKKELRNLMKHKLPTISPNSITTQSAAIFKSVTAFKPYLEAKRVGIYLSMPTGEVQTDALVSHALESGKKVFVPYLYKPQNPPPDTPRSVMDMVDIRSLADYTSLKQDNWGIPTIDAETVDQREHVLENATKESLGLDMILMPGVAFDIDPKTGYARRLGHGKGFYDYFLNRYTQVHGSHTEENSMGPKTDALLYGLALDEQFLQAETEPSVPVGDHDSLLHGLAIGNGKLVEGPIKRE